MNEKINRAAMLPASGANETKPLNMQTGFSVFDDTKSKAKRQLKFICVRAAAPRIFATFGSELGRRILAQ